MKIITKWTAEIMDVLVSNKGIARFGEIEKTCKEILGVNISPRSLSKELDRLISIGAITKKIYAEVPPRVEYTVTQRGYRLLNIIDATREFIKKK